MPYQLFHDVLPEIAERETRVLRLVRVAEAGPLEPRYSFLEMFCNEPGCDCRRVFFYVMSSDRQALETVIAWGWEPPAFYARWIRDDDAAVIAEIKGPALNRGSPHTSRAPVILSMVENILLRDEAYVDRIKRHYALFRAEIDRRDKSSRVGTARGRNKRRKP